MDDIFILLEYTLQQSLNGYVYKDCLLSGRRFFFIFKANLDHGGLRDIKRARVASSIQWNFKFYFTTCEKVPEIRFFECFKHICSGVLFLF